ncbi:MAG: hypothetical protein ABGZ53_06180, partial [Fuerstiella sp.]
ARKLLQGRRTKHWMRTFYAIMSAMKLKKSNLQGSGYKEFFQAGKSVETIDNVLSVADIYEELRTGRVSSRPVKKLERPVSG